MKQLVVLVGPPGSGKSTFAMELVQKLGYVYVNQDSQGKEEHLAVFNLALMENLNIVVDRMNFNKVQRARYLNEAKKEGYETNIIVIHQPYQVCLERCLARQNHETIKDEKSARSALQTFFTKYERPTEDEASTVEFKYSAELSNPLVRPLAVICDLDGTLCNINHRLHFVKGEGKKNWKAFFDNIADDQPNYWCWHLVHNMKNSFQIVYASGRPDNYKKVTEAWLEAQHINIHNGHLYMRNRNDNRQDYIVKEIILDFEILTRFKPLFFIDDRKQVVDMYRSRGFTVLQCAKGEF